MNINEVAEKATNEDMDAIVCVEDKEYLYWRDLKEALERLEKNEDFKKVILEGYFKDKAINGVSLLASPQIKAQGKRADVMESLVAISHLQDYFLVIKAMGEDIPEDEDDENEEENSNNTSK